MQTNLVLGCRSTDVVEKRHDCLSSKIFLKKFLFGLSALTHLADPGLSYLELWENPWQRLTMVTQGAEEIGTLLKVSVYALLIVFMNSPGEGRSLRRIAPPHQTMKTPLTMLETKKPTEDQQTSDGPEQIRIFRLASLQDTSIR